MKIWLFILMMILLQAIDAAPRNRPINRGLRHLEDHKDVIKREEIEEDDESEESNESKPTEESRPAEESKPAEENKPSCRLVCHSRALHKFGLTLPHEQQKIVMFLCQKLCQFFMNID